MPSFIILGAVNLVFPNQAWIPHIFYIGFMVIKEIYEFLIGLLFATNFLWRTFFLGGFAIFKYFDWLSIEAIFRAAHVILTENNLYLWILNYYAFGIFGTWPLLRPDIFENYQVMYCSYWSC